MHNPERVEDLEINEMEDGFIIYDASTDKVHFLNHTATFVLEYCNGQHSVDEIAKIMQDAWQLDETPRQEVGTLVQQLRKEKLLREE